MILVAKKVLLDGLSLILYFFEFHNVELLLHIDSLLHLPAFSKVALSADFLSVLIVLNFLNLLRVEFFEFLFVSVVFFLLEFQKQVILPKWVNKLFVF